MKRAFVFFLALSFVISTLSVSISAKESTHGDITEWMESESYIDDIYKYDLSADEETGGGIKNYPYYIEAITELGFMEKDELLNFNETNTVKKNEFQMIISKVLGNALAYDEVILKEYGNSSELTVKEAVAVLIDLLGYGVDAEYAGENGILLTAIKIGLLKGVDYNGLDSFITRGTLAHILYNSFDIKIQKTEFSDEALITVPAEEATLLSVYHEMYEVKGFLNAVEGLDAFSDDEPGENTVQIDRVEYSSGETDYRTLFGRTVKGYFRIINDVRTLVFIRPDEEHMSQIITINDDCEISGSRLTYYKDGEEHKTSLDSVSYFSYNGKVTNVSELADILSSNDGILILSDVDKSGTKAAVFKAYKSYVVAAVTDTDGTSINLKYNMQYKGSNSIEIPDDATLVIRNASGLKADLTSIAENDVISIFNTDRYYEIIVSTAIKSGTVSGIDSGGSVIMNDGSSYKISDEYLTEVNAGNSKVSEIKAGDAGTFYLSFNGYICGVLKSNTRLFGYLRKAVLAEEDDGERVFIRIFATDAKWYNYYLSEYVTLDGVRVESIEAFESIKSQADSLIRYSKNTSDLITFIDTLNDTAAESGDTERMKYTTSWSDKMDWTGGLNFKNCEKSVSLTDDTYIFCVPDNKETERDYQIQRRTALYQNLEVSLDFYNADSFYRVPVVLSPVLKEKYATIASTFFALQSVGQKLNADEEMVHYVKGITWATKSAQVSEFVISEELYDKIESGEADALVKNCVYRYQLKNNEISHMVLDVYEGNVPNDFIENAGDVHERVIGTVSDRDGYYIKIGINSDEVVWRAPNVKNIVIYDSSDKEFLIGDLNDIRTGDRIYIYGQTKADGSIFIVH